MSDSIIEELSEERKELQKTGEIPEWYTTQGYQLFKSKYSINGETVKGAFERVAKASAEHIKHVMPDAEEKFFNLMWSGKLAPSTPVMANMGSDRGCPVSCSGNYVPDNVDGFYTSLREIALLSKHGFGTSGHMSDVRPRGSDISIGGKASGITPVLNSHVQVARDVSQGSSRRGAYAAYIDIEHPDFYEVIDGLVTSPDDKNIGWIVCDSFIDKLNSGCPDSLSRYQKTLKTKAVTGKGYYFFKDKVNRASPQMYKDLGLEVKASNLCTEITLFSDEDHTFTCVLSSLNASRWDDITDDDIFMATVFLDCVASAFIKMGSTIKGLEKAVAFTEKSRALGLGVLGFHTYLQQKMEPFEGIGAMVINEKIFKRLDEVSKKASEWMGKELGEPEWCWGYGVRNTHRLAVAPNTSSALLCGGVSQGIEPVVENVYLQSGAGGEMERINPVLLDIMRDRKVYSKKTIGDIIDNNGSVQHVDWLSDDEKLVFKTAFEINQSSILTLAGNRQKYIDQAQSINLFFDADAPEAHISKIHKDAFMNENIKSLYYMRSKAGIKASTGECVACEG